MNTDALTLRETNNPPLTNKGDRILNSEYDQNWIDAYNDFLALAQAPLITAYNASTLYDDTNNPFASYNNRLWKWINTSSGSGVTPVEGANWTEIFPTQLAHEQNKDTYLAKGTSDEVTANEIRSFIDTPVSSSNIGTDNLVIDDNVRTLRLAGPLSTDNFAFQNNAGTVDILKVNGDETIRFGAASKANYLGPSTSSYLFTAPLGGKATLVDTTLQSCSINLNMNGNNQSLYSLGNLYIGGTIVGNGSRKTSFHKTAGAPTTNITNVVDVFCDDDSSGVAGLVIKPEDGKKLTLTRYQNAAFGNTVNTGDANTDALINALITGLTDRGWIES